VVAVSCTPAELAVTWCADSCWLGGGVGIRAKGDDDVLGVCC